VPEARTGLSSLPMSHVQNVQSSPPPFTPPYAIHGTQSGNLMCWHRTDDFRWNCSFASRESSIFKHKRASTPDS